MSPEHQRPSPAVRHLLGAEAVRQRCGEILDLGVSGGLRHFTIHLDRLGATADLVIAITREAYPDGRVPVHSRWRHFEVAGDSFWDAVADNHAWASPFERLRAEIDLAAISVLLDAGAGNEWHYRDPIGGAHCTRSEGLAIASLRMFAAGLFSADPSRPLRCDGRALRALTLDRLSAGFQAGPSNHLVGLEGRLSLLHDLGRVLGDTRPSVLVDDLAINAPGASVSAPDLLGAVLTRFNSIWPGRVARGGVGLGDVWQHFAVRRDDATEGLVPFHKLSQWLTYSLIEPIERAGVTMTDMEGLTGLAEYRNGGLFLDMGVLALRDPSAAENVHPVGSELVVEWRALTVTLLDRLAEVIRERTGEPDRWPLARVLQGGTWTAGRQVARDRRPDGAPPIRVNSDGTVF